MNDYRSTDGNLTNALIELTDGLNDLTNWSIWNGDLALDDIIEFKQHFMKLEKRIRDTKEVKS